MKKFLSILVAAIFLFDTQVNLVSAYYTNMPASNVLGQPDFTSGSTGSAANSFSSQRQIAICSGKFIVADRGNHRVLIFNTTPKNSNTSADVVIGQIDFSGNASNQGLGVVAANTLRFPSGVICYGEKLLVGDAGNRRVLIYNSIPTSNNTSADVVIGQASMTASATTCDARTLDGSTDELNITLANDKLVVADSVHHRVLVWNTIPTTNGVSADTVIGQSDLSSCSANRGGSVGSNTTNRPRNVYYYDQKLYVADSSNNRVLIYNSIPTSNGISADVVIGQSTFVSNSANQGGNPGANTLQFPQGLIVINNRLLISDFSNNRVLIYNSIPAANNASADIVLGQESFTVNSSNQGGSTSANTLTSPKHFLLNNNQLYVSDGNNRILIFDNTLSTPGVGVDTPLTKLGDGTNRLRLYGNVLLGERGKYTLQSVKVNLNGGGFGEVTYLDGTGRSDGSDFTRYDFNHDFSPWTNLGSNITKDNWSEMEHGYTLAVRASSLNAEDSTIFTFAPFILNSVSSQGAVNTFLFKVTKDQVDRIKSNIKSFEVWVKGKDATDYSLYLRDIPTAIIDSSGNGSFTNLTNSISSSALTPGVYDIKLKALSKESSWGFYSNTLSSLTLSGSSFSATPISDNFPLQINKITGTNLSILSTTNAKDIKSSYTSTTSTPTLTGIAFANTNITLTVTNANNPKQTTTYTTKTLTNSTFTLTPKLYGKSLLNLSVTDPLTNKFSYLPTITINQTNTVLGVETTKQTTQIQKQPTQPTFTPTPTPQQQTTPSPQPTPEPTPTKKSCFLWWCR